MHPPSASPLSLKNPRREISTDVISSTPRAYPPKRVSSALLLSRGMLKSVS